MRTFDARFAWNSPGVVGKQGEAGCFVSWGLLWLRVPTPSLGIGDAIAVAVRPGRVIDGGGEIHRLIADDVGDGGGAPHGIHRRPDEAGGVIEENLRARVDGIGNAIMVGIGEVTFQAGLQVRVREWGRSVLQKGVGLAMRAVRGSGRVAMAARRLERGLHWAGWWLPGLHSAGCRLARQVERGLRRPLQGLLPAGCRVGGSSGTVPSGNARRAAVARA